MPFIKMPDFVGKVYVPDKKPEYMKKHNCKDCFSCQMCSDDRCRLCRGNICKSNTFKIRCAGEKFNKEKMKA